MLLALKLVGPLAAAVDARAVSFQVSMTNNSRFSSISFFKNVSYRKQIARRHPCQQKFDQGRWRVRQGYKILV